MEIRTKFNVGDKVWTIRQSEVAEKCPICNGKEKIKIKNKKYRCPECDGDGYIRKLYPEWVVFDRKREIKEIIIDIDRELIYSVEYNKYDAKDCFATKEQAQKECDRRNAQK